MSRFIEGGGSLLDLEYLTDDNGRRLTTFAKMAGYIGSFSFNLCTKYSPGMAAGILAWCHQQLHPKKAESPRHKRRLSKEGLSALTTADQVDKELPLLQYIQVHLLV